MDTQILDQETLKTGIEILCKSESRFADVLERYGSPPLWNREPGFETLVQIILEQQVSLSSARAAYQRLMLHLGEIRPQNFLKLEDHELLTIGFSRQKREYCRQLARAVHEGHITLDKNTNHSDQALRDSLMKINGIGEWTVDIYFLMALRRPDIWPRHDLALSRAVQDLFNLPQRPDSVKLQKMNAKWRPWRAVAARILWHYYLNQPSKRTRNNSA